MKDLCFILDQGTTQHKVSVFDRSGKIIDQLQTNAPKLKQFAEGLGYEAQSLTQMSNDLILQVLQKYGSRLAGFGFANQGESVLAWQKSLGKSLSPIVSWQCQSGDEILQTKSSSFDLIRDLTGLIPSSYFSAPKMIRILQTNLKSQEVLKNDDLILGTLDTWMISQWTKQRVAFTDASTACRTLLFDIHQLEWSDKLLKIFEIPRSILATVKKQDEMHILCDNGPFTEQPLPLLASLCDQPASLIGHGGSGSRVIKMSLGTGAFVDLSVEQPVSSKQFLSSVIQSDSGKTNYYLEGGVLSFASAIEWMEREWSVIRQDIFQNFNKETGLEILPAFSGMGAPFFQASQKTQISGLGLEHTKLDLAIATMQGLVFRLVEIVETMAKEFELPKSLQVDGGLSRSQELMQFLANASGKEIVIFDHPHITSVGVAKVVFEKLDWDFKEDTEKKRKVIVPQKETQVGQMYQRWKKFWAK